jgi:hypothetical protein
MPPDRAYPTIHKASKAWLANQAFVPHTLELLRSPAWQQRSIYAVRLIEALERDHLSHAGRENGYLHATWEQLGRAGIPNRRVAQAIAEAEALGLVKVTHRGAYRGGARNDPSTYKLTYLPAKLETVGRPRQYYNPTDEWRRVAGKIRSNAPPGGANSHAQGEQSAPADAPQKIVKSPRRAALGTGHT